jgi:hypothetical protein
MMLYYGYKNMIEIKRWFWNDKEVTREEYEALNTLWKEQAEKSESEQDQPEKKSRKHKK